MTSDLLTPLQRLQLVRIGKMPSKTGKAPKSDDQEPNGESTGKKAAPGKAAKKPFPKRIKPASKKRSKELRQYSPKKAKFLADNPICQVEGCGRQAVDLHHIRGRSGKQLIEVADFMAVCRDHHKEMDSKDAEHRANGNIKSRLGPAKK